MPLELEFAIDGKTPGELEQRRRDIVMSLQRDYPGGYDDPNVPLPLLRQLADICSTLRRKTSGPPKAKRQGNSRQKATLDDLL